LAASYRALWEAIEMMASFLDNLEFSFLSPVEFPNKAIINVWYWTINARTMIQGELHCVTECSKGGGGCKGNCGPSSPGTEMSKSGRGSKVSLLINRHRY
jgi:hypothetical protein